MIKNILRIFAVVLFLSVSTISQSKPASISADNSKIDVLKQRCQVSKFTAYPGRSEDSIERACECATLILAPLIQKAESEPSSPEAKLVVRISTGGDFVALTTAYFIKHPSFRAEVVQNCLYQN